MNAPVIPLRRKPAYTPLDPPARCQTPGHGDREGRRYPGGRLCPDCLPSRNDDTGDDR